MERPSPPPRFERSVSVTGSGDVLELEAGVYPVNLHLTQVDLILRAAPGAEVTLTSV